MPAWQKRQPAVQPRMTSMTTRSWTASSTGTTGRRTGSLSANPVKIWRWAGPALAPGHPHAGHGRERLQALLAAVLLHGGDDRLQVVLDLPDEERVEERRQRPRVGDRGAAAEDDGVFPIPLGGVQRHAGEVEHLEDVGVAELVRQGEAPEVALADRRERLQRPQRHAAGAHEVGHVRPRAVGPLGGGRRGVVQLTVEDLQRGVGDPDLVHVRIGQDDAGTCPGLDAGVELSTRVAPGPRDARQQSRYLIRRPSLRRGPGSRDVARSSLMY